MPQHRRKAVDDANGFTLIELVIVIALLGLLAAVVVFAVNGIQVRGTRSACKSDIVNVTTASEAYYALNGDYAANAAALVTAGLLKSTPSTTNGYTVLYIAPPTGSGPNVAATVTGLMTTGGSC
jgi:prepilin-type N-terminal cleavage/methylation domain-containing protein